MKQLSTKAIMRIVIGVVLLIVGIWINPLAYNEATQRTVVTKANGGQFVKFGAGIYFAGFLAKKTEWPNQISVSYTDTAFDGKLSINDNVIEIGVIRDTRFNDATTAAVSGITQYGLPMSEKEMIAIHNAHKTPEAFVQRRLSPYTVECLMSSAQLMSSEMHYSGGRAQMTQDYMDQLKNGSYLLNVKELNTFDSIELVNKKVYAVQIQKNSNGVALRKFSSIKEYGVVVGDAQITKVDYETKVDEMLAKKISAATDASVSKQRLMTAQQQQLTAEAEGKKKLVDIEYQEKQEQTKQVVAAQTTVELAKQDLLKQDIALQASYKEAQKIKTLADATAYEKRTIMQADGALDKKLDAYKYVMAKGFEAMGAYTGSWVPSVMMGNGVGGGNAATQMMEALSVKAMRDLALDMTNQKN